MITFSFASDLTNKLTLIVGVCALIVSIISNLMIKKGKKIITEESEPKPIIDQEYKV